MPFAETYVSVDVETAGPTPSAYSLLSIGACLVDEPSVGFYVELRPERSAYTDEALAVTGLSMEHLAAQGEEPKVAMQAFADWVEGAVPADRRAVFTAFNAPFDWMFVADAFARHLGHNPFGHSALDIKAYAMGRGRTSWAATSMSDLAPQYLGGRELTHNALADARDQAELFRGLLAEHA